MCVCVYIYIKKNVILRSERRERNKIVKKKKKKKIYKNARFDGVRHNKEAAANIYKVSKNDRVLGIVQGVRSFQVRNEQFYTVLEIQNNWKS